LRFEIGIERYSKSFEIICKYPNLPKTFSTYLFSLSQTCNCAYHEQEETVDIEEKTERIGKERGNNNGQQSFSVDKN